MHDGMPYDPIQGQGQGHALGVDRHSRIKGELDVLCRPRAQQLAVSGRWIPRAWIPSLRIQAIDCETQALPRRPGQRRLRDGRV